MQRFLESVSVGLGLGLGLNTPRGVYAQAPGPSPSTSGLALEFEALLELAVAHPSRHADRARDRYRHPAETLAFFGVRPDMRVAEYAPGDGWYSRLLAPYLAAQGHHRVLPLDPGSRLCRDWPHEEEERFDHVLVLRVMHRLLMGEEGRRELLRLRNLLKPGGLLGIEQHRAPPGAGPDHADGANGYLPQDLTIVFVAAHGFDFLDASEINANPHDRADHPGGVWSLLPTLACDPQREDAHRAIGESDRMTLLFRRRD
ncbi:class I SAM-dependent methyltransferase [Novosphingobium sp. 9]|uniref:class I SAM-dependent methyltransferase n=1 Tax=Novosphingobium sp. 9 TaxID=2025349 RepID=UPI0021B60695|nr:methyltransferase [Novosphingobium sp. 9]